MESQNRREQHHMSSTKNNSTFMKHADQVRSRNSPKQDFSSERRDSRHYNQRGANETKQAQKSNYHTNRNFTPTYNHPDLPSRSGGDQSSSGYHKTHDGDISYHKSFHGGDKSSSRHQQFQSVDSGRTSSGDQKSQSHNGQNSSGYQKSQFVHKQSPSLGGDQNSPGYQKSELHGSQTSSGYQKSQFGHQQSPGDQKSQSHGGQISFKPLSHGVDNVDKSMSNHQQSPSHRSGQNYQKTQYGGGTNSTGYQELLSQGGFQNFKHGDSSNQTPYMYQPISVPLHGGLTSPLQSHVQQPTYGYNNSGNMYPQNAINMSSPQYGFPNMYNYHSSVFNSGHFGNKAPSYHHTSTNQQHSTYVPMSQQQLLLNHGEQIVDQENLDKEWLREWLEKKKIEKSIDSLNKTKSDLKICEANVMIHRCLILTDELKTLRDKLEENIDDISDEEWANHMIKVNKIKEELVSNRNILSDPEVIKNLNDKLQKRRKKRLWWKNRMERRYLARNEDVQRRETLHKEIDVWREKKIAEDLALRKESMLKREAGGVLGEVRRKQADSRKLLEVLKSVKKLRGIRKSEGEKKGVYPKTSLEVDNKFKEECDNLENFIMKRLESYENEEKALRVMLVEEEEEREKKEEQQRQEQRALLNITNEDNHGLTSFQEYYGQAEKSLGYLIQVRREWDAYMVPEHIYGGSRIPDGEIQPCLPSSEVWSSALTTNKDDIQCLNPT